MGIYLDQTISSLGRKCQPATEAAKRHAQSAKRFDESREET